MLENVHWLGHACIKFTGKTIIYIDPYKISGGEKADIILITHDHYDHLSKEDIHKIHQKDTVIVLPESASGSIKGNIRTVSPGDCIDVQGVKIQAVPAYNTGKRFHPKEASHVGYVLTVDDVTYYHAGDTDLIPEMDEIEADVAFLPIGGTYTMNAEEAAQAARSIGTKIVVPIHWGTIIGSKADAERFKQLCDCDVRIMKKES
jgi:L-ascorbate metabolism protein UlaG (beta-lactamase superfamily)